MIYLLPFTILLLYFIKIFEYIIAWTKPIKTDKQIKAKKLFISVIIPFRNEEKNIKTLINNLKKQTYDNNLLEIILIDDNSTDNSFNIAQNLIDNCNIFKITKLTKYNYGKKNAILKGVNQAKGELIITSDADCIHKPSWITTIANFYNSTNYELISAPVKIIENSFFANLQAIEFFSLNISGGASVLCKKPILLNAANLAFTKQRFTEFSNNLNKKHTSGDDIFLLLNFKKHHRQKIGFLKSRKALVKTFAQNNIKNFFNQRKRWISKTGIYKDFNITYTGILNTTINITILTLFIISIFNHKIIPLASLFFLLKILIDLIFFATTNKIYKIKNLYILFPLIEILYPFYILFMMIFGFFGKFTWKNRTYNK